MRFAAGQIVSEKFRVLSALGEGAMGTVYAVEHLTLRVHLALKVLAPHLARRPEQVERFLREGVAISRVRHRAVVQVFDAGKHEALPWIAMELLEGETLRARFARGGITAREALTILQEVLGGLAASHAQGIVHRDVKPTNIHLARQPDGTVQPKLLDFGIARVMDAEERLTGAGMTMGTLHYMAPEQIHAARDVDARADLYAVGAILFEALSGRPPYRASSVNELVTMLATQPSPDLAAAAPQQPRVLVEIVNRCLARNPNERPQDARQLASMLDAALRFSDQPAGVLPSTLVLPGLEQSRPGAVDAMSATAPAPVFPQTASPQPSQPVPRQPALRTSPLPDGSAWQQGSQAGTPAWNAQSPAGGWAGQQQGSYPGNAGSYPGSYPGSQPGTYPGSQHGSYPGSQHGSYPGSQQGSWAGQPGWPGQDPAALFAPAPKRSALWHLFWIAPLGILLMIGSGYGVVRLLDDREDEERADTQEATNAVAATDPVHPAEPDPTRPVMLPIGQDVQPLQPSYPTLAPTPVPAPVAHACVGVWRGPLLQSDGQRGSAVVTIRGTEDQCGGFVERWQSGAQCHYRLSGCATEGSVLTASARTPAYEACSPVRMRFTCEDGRLRFLETASSVTVTSLMSPHTPD